MKDHQIVMALRRRIDGERTASGQQRVRFSKNLREAVLALAGAPGWSRERAASALGLASSVLYRWHAQANPQTQSAPRSEAGALTRVEVVGSASANPDDLVLVFPNGAQVKGLSLEQLAHLLGGLK